MTADDILDTAGVAAMFGVAHETVHKWRDRGLLPKPTGYVSRCPYWRRDALEFWGKKTGRKVKSSGGENARGDEGWG